MAINKDTLFIEFHNALKRVEKINVGGLLADEISVLVKLGEEARNPAPLAAIPASGAIEFFDHASDSIKWPKVSFPEGVTFSRAGDKARLPGTINVTDGGPYGAGLWFGRIDRKGVFRPGRDCTPEVKAVVNRFGDEPVAEAVRAGKASGNCVFCSKDLTTDGSVAAGYGPTCAKTWGLAWSAKV